MDAYLDRIAPEKLTVLCASGFFFDDRRLTFIDEYGGTFLSKRSSKTTRAG
jgi:hypothetical protein